jgi:tight adherence protein C
MMTQIVILIAVFVSVAGLSYVVSQWLVRDRLMGRRLAQLHATDGSLAQSNEGLHPWRVKIIKLAAPIARLSAPKEGWEKSSLRVRFMCAGLRGAGWPVLFFSAKTLLALALPGLLIMSGYLGAGALTGQAAQFVLVALAALGYYLPNVLLALVIRARQRELCESLPDAVDLMTVCVEAGLALDAALSRAGEEMNLRSSALADELNLVTLELRVGSTREAALHNLALRTGVDDITTFVTMLLQSERFGTSVADSLRILSETMRDHRRQRAEETAAKIPVKLLFPLVFFIFPALFLVLIGPAFIGIFKTLLPAMGSGH